MKIIHGVSKSGKLSAEKVDMGIYILRGAGLFMFM